MSTKAADKIIDALVQLLEGYSDLQQAVEEDLGLDLEKDGLVEEDIELNPEMDAAMVTELRFVIETVMETEDYSTEEVASLISNLTDALEEIDPDVFETEDIEIDIDEEDEDIEDYDDDLDDDDDYEDDLDEDDDD